VHLSIFISVTNQLDQDAARYECEKKNRKMTKLDAGIKWKSGGGLLTDCFKQHRDKQYCPWTGQRRTAPSTKFCKTLPHNGTRVLFLAASLFSSSFALGQCQFCASVTRRHLKLTVTSNWQLHHTDSYTKLTVTSNWQLHQTDSYITLTVTPNWQLHQTDSYITLTVTPNWLLHPTDSYTKLTITR